MGSSRRGGCKEEHSAKGRYRLCILVTVPSGWVQVVTAGESEDKKSRALSCSAGRTKKSRAHVTKQIAATTPN